MAYRIRVIGRVQGVFFRVSAKEKADSLGLHGWVRNEKDGSVLIEVQGAQEKIEEFIQWCHVGSSSSKVDHVETEEIGEQGYREFRITY